MTPDLRMIFVREAEHLFQVRHGAVRALVNEKRLRCARRGRRTKVSVKQVAELLGVGIP